MRCLAPEPFHPHSRCVLGKWLALRAAQRSLLMVVSCTQEEAAKSLLAEFNLGCDVQHTGHVYRVYVNTFLGFGGNFARQRYEELVLNQTYVHNRYCCPAWSCPGIAQRHWLLCATLSPLDFPQEPPVVDSCSYSHAGSSWVPAGACAGTWHNGIALVGACRHYQCHCLSSFPFQYYRNSPTAASGFPCFGFPSLFSTGSFSTSFHCILTSTCLLPYFLKLFPDLQRFRAQVLPCWEKTLPPDVLGSPWGCRSPQVGGNRLHPMAPIMCSGLVATDLESLASAGVGWVTLRTMSVQGDRVLQ